MGPHRLNAPSRPAWFFEKEKYGGILCDIGSHQIEQFLFYTGAKDAEVVHSKIANYNHPEYSRAGRLRRLPPWWRTTAPHGYFRVDWFTPDGLSTWGDGRTFISGHRWLHRAAQVRGPGPQARRRTTSSGRTRTGEHYFNATGKTGFPFFGQLVLDCIHRTENAMTQEHALKAAELCVRAQLQAEDLSHRG